MKEERKLEDIVMNLVKTPEQYLRDKREVPDGEFFECTGITEITIPHNCKRIGKFAFYRCTALKNVIIEDGVEELDEGCFYCCTALEEITIPESVKTIGKKALGFVDCKVNIIIDHFMVYTISSFRLEKFSLDEIREQCRKSGAGRVDVNLAVKYDAAQKALARSAQATNKKVKLTTRKSEVGGKD